MRSPARLQSLLKLTAGLLGVLVLAACGAPRQDSADAAADKPFKVVTTFLPITLFSRAVAGDCATVTPLIPASTGPHDFQAKPGDLTALRQAQVLVKNGLEMESFLDKLVASAGNPQLKVIDTSRSMPTLSSDYHDAAQGAAQGAAEGVAQGANQSQGQVHGHGHDHGAVNPHIWLDPLRAVQQVETIRDGLVKADPSCAEGYRRNAAAYIAELKKLNSEIAAQLQPYRGKTFVAFHDFAPYFAQRYGLKAEYMLDVPEINPSPLDLQRVAAAVKGSQLKALVSEPQEGNRSFNALARDLGVKIVAFDPLETASEQASRDPATYLALMRRNATDLRQAFGQ